MEKIEAIAESNQDFKEARETYVQQYGMNKIRYSEPTNLEGSIAPVAVVSGRNCIVTHSDSSRVLKGSLGSISILPDELYVIGRREPQDSKLVAWNTGGGVELQEYNSLADTIPFRVHGIIANLERGEELCMWIWAVLQELSSSVNPPILEVRLSGFMIREQGRQTRSSWKKSTLQDSSSSQVPVEIYPQSNHTLRFQPTHGS